MEVAQTLEELEAMYSDEDSKKKGKKAPKAKPPPKGKSATTAAASESAADAPHSDEEAGGPVKGKSAGAKKDKAKGKKAPDPAGNGVGGGGGEAASKPPGADAAVAPAASAASTKTAAEKRKDKKEREKAKKAAEGKKTGETEAETTVKEKAGEKEVVEKKAEEKNVVEKKVEEKKADVKKADEKKAEVQKAEEEKAEEKKVQEKVKEKKADEEADDGDEEGGDKGGEEKEMSAARKKKLKKKEKEKEKKATTTGATAASAAGGEGAGKKPTSAVAKLIKQQLEKQREEEERLRRLEEEAERKREEERLRREEEERIERERKERRKLKEKERKKRLKEEGKLLTQKQKQDRQRLQQMIQLSGVELPAAAAEEDSEQQHQDDQQQPQQQQKKKPKYEKLKRHRPAAAVATPTSEQAPQQTQVQQQPAEAAVADSWEDALLDTTWERMDTADEWPAVQPAAKRAARAEEDDAAAESSSSLEDEEDDEDDDDEGSSDSGDTERDEVDPIERARQRIAQRRETALAKAAEAAASATAPLRCPLVCVLGHVDTGKTSILDKLRKTHVQDGEAGGITQQIGATNVPAASILAATRMVKSLDPDAMSLPGLLIIDTPGHESFSNLRSRGSSLCDVAILVVDIMHGIEPQTIESIQLLKQRGTPFIVALNKVDRLYDWQKNANVDVFVTLRKQGQATRNDFEDRLKLVVAHFAMQELNVCLSCDNKNFDDYISLVPTSAHSGDGMGNLMAHICELSLRKLRSRLVYHDDLEATVMEVKEITGLGTTVDVCLVNGKLHEADTIILAGQEGPIVTQVRGLLMPMPMKEMRVKNQYDKFKEVRGAQAVKLIAKDLEKALAGLPIYCSKDPDEIEVYKMDVSAKLSKVLKSIEVQDTGVYVQASTLGSLEALLLFLRTEKIPYCGINIGPVHKRDVTKCSIMLEKDTQWAVILAFDVKVEREAQELADSVGVRIFTADIIYHLSDAFMKWRDDRAKAEREKFKDVAVFPCKVRILPQFIFNSRDPIVCGVVVEAGILKVGSPIAVPSKECAYLGRVESLELNHKKVDEAKRGAEVCLKIAAPPGEAPKMYGRHFDHNDMLMTRVTRESIDALKQYFRDDLSKDDWKLVIELKKAFNVF